MIEISEFLQTRIDAGDFPSAVYLVAEKNEIIFRDARGFAVVKPEKIAADNETIYDLASLTKPLVTGLLCAKLVEKRAINLTDKISKFFSEFDSADKREITIQQLLTHTSGFQAWLPLYFLSPQSAAQSSILQIIANQQLAALSAKQVIYSDLNFIVLGFLLENIYGERLDKIAEREIFAPLNLKNTFFNPPKSRKKQIAASESGNNFELNLAAESGFNPENQSIRHPQAKIRNQIWGEVHDGNCYFMDGVSGHAGLFSTATETFKIALQFLPHSTQLLKPETCKLFRTNFTPKLNEARAIAFQLAATDKSTASEALAKDSFGHLGFAGTSLWIEPATERIYILLTNRTHARSLPFVNINATRRKFHELATKFAGKHDN